MKSKNLIREFTDVYKYHLKWNSEHAFHDFNNVYLKAIADLQKLGLSNLKGKKVLDLGCGSRFPFSLLAAREGAEVTALDLSYVKPDPLPAFFINLIRYNGVKRAFKSLTRRVLFDRHYFKSLDKAAGAELKHSAKEITFITGDPNSSNYPLPANAFDLIESNAVLEHVVDIDKYFKEIYRLLNGPGFFYGLIHNYYSISGGHYLEWSMPDTNPSQTVPPWDHLRKNLFPTHIYLNKLKPEDYKRAAINAGLNVLLFQGRDVNHDAGGKEGEKLFTPEIEQELSQYTKELLLTRAYCIICKK